MSRPKPQILLEAVHKDTYKAEQILAAEAIYSVFYEGKPINMRTLNKLVSYPGPKYKKVSFSNSGHAFNLADSWITLGFMILIFNILFMNKKI